MPTRHMPEKVAQGRENAERALDAYRATGGQDPDTVVAISDLIADLLHLADAEIAANDGDINEAAVLAFTALEHYEYERDPANAHDEV